MTKGFYWLRLKMLVISSYQIKTGHTCVISNRNTFEKLLVILEFKHFSKNQTSSKRYRNKEVINEFTVSVAVNIAGLNISMD